MASDGEASDGWAGPEPLPNELSVERLSQIYSGTAAFYDGVVGDKQARAKLVAIDLLDRHAGERFLEIGVGTAWALRHVMQRSGSWNACAVDVSYGMVEVARDTLHTESAAGSPLLLLGDARRLPFKDYTFECLLITYTLEVLPASDIARVVDEMLRVLMAGGRAAIVNLTDGTEGEDASETMITDWKERFAGDPESFGGARPLQLETMLRKRGFGSVTRRFVGPDWPSEVLLATKPG